tara:strand:- start:1201 stop:1557 length:357 start_codon:yes stop_codon:yes gene_type:complete
LSAPLSMAKMDVPIPGQEEQGSTELSEGPAWCDSIGVAYHIYQEVPLSSPITRHLDKQQSAQALIIAGLGLQSFTHQPTGDNERKTRLDNLDTYFDGHGNERIPVRTSQRSPWMVDSK